MVEEKFYLWTKIRMVMPKSHSNSLEMAEDTEQMFDFDLVF